MLDVRHLPNIICVLRIVLVWPIAAALAGAEYLLALALFVVAGLSDGIDGYLAKRFKWTSELGKFLDPLADKLLLVTVFVQAAWLNLAPWWLTSAVVARDVLIGLGAMVYRLWFGPLRGRPTLSSKINTAMQLLYVMAMLVNAALSGGALAFRLPEILDTLAHEVRDALAILVFVTTVFSGLNYMAVFTRRAWETPVSSS